MALQRKTTALQQLQEKNLLLMAQLKNEAITQNTKLLADLQENMDRVFNMAHSYEITTRVINVELSQHLNDQILHA